VVDVKWPPETFIWRTFQQLAVSGVKVQVGVSTRPGQRLPHISDLMIVKLPTWSRPWLNRLGNFLCFLLSRGVFYPLSFFRLLRILLVRAKRDRLSFRDKIVSLYRCLPFVGLKPDILHFQWNTAAIEYLPLFDFFGCPKIISCRGSQINIAPHNPKRTSIRMGLEMTFQRAGAVHCVSEAIKHEAVQYGLDLTKSWVIKPAVDATFFCPPKRRSSENSTLQVISIGALNWRKGYEYALIAIRQLLDLGISAEYEIIGDGPERQRVLYTINDLGLQKNVFLSGQLDPDKVRDRLQESDVFVLSSVSEGISNAVLEAMACGLPVVVSDCGGMREAVNDGVEGFVVPVWNSEALACALQSLATNPELRRHMGEAGRKKILTEFSLNKQVNLFLELYQSLVGNK
jgi:colanic acid/amylovoran biosynthesis glycosyltransferase